MKPRTVMVILELRTNLPLEKLRVKRCWDFCDDNTGMVGVEVRQVTVSVAQPAKEKKVKR